MKKKYKNISGQWKTVETKFADACIQHHGYCKIHSIHPYFGKWFYYSCMMHEKKKVKKARSKYECSRCGMVILRLTTNWYYFT